MIRHLFLGAALALSVLAPCIAAADGYAPPDAGPRHVRRHHHHHDQSHWRRRALPPEIAYRDPSFAPVSRRTFAHGGFGPPAFAEIEPRSLALPLYNEPPPRFTSH